MDTIKRYTVLLALLEAMKEQGSWRGETQVQKCAYSLQTMLGVPMDYEYILYKHGPFSFDLREDLAFMRAHYLVSLEGQPYPYGPSLSLGESADALRKRFPEAWQEFEKQHRFIAENISKRDVTDLERFSTALYVTHEMQQSASAEERAKHLTALKPHISVEQAQRALEEVGRLIAASSSLAVQSLQEGS